MRKIGLPKSLGAVGNMLINKRKFLYMHFLWLSASVSKGNEGGRM